MATHAGTLVVANNQFDTAGPTIRRWLGGNIEGGSINPPPTPEAGPVVISPLAPRAVEGGIGYTLRP